jgi:membrane associated rhomboid family serine protease
VLEPGSRITTVVPAVVYFEVATLPAAFVIGMWFLLQVAAALAPIGDATPVAWFAHLGGFVAGVALVVPMAVARSSPKRSKSRKPSASKRREAGGRRAA